jgi:hypothetical protein
MRAHTACGWTIFTSTVVLYGSYYKSTAYPNPATGGIVNLKIEVNQETYEEMRRQAQTENRTTLSPEPIFTVRLYNDRGMLASEKRSVREGVTTFDTSNWPSGIYYLHIYNEIDEKPEVLTIIVK